MLIFAICWLLNIYGGYLGVHPRWRPIVDVRANVHSGQAIEDFHRVIKIT